MDEGLKEGSLTVARTAVLSVLQTRFPGAPVPEGVRSALEKSTDIQKMNAWLHEAVLTAAPADLEHFLPLPLIEVGGFHACPPPSLLAFPRLPGTVSNTYTATFTGQIAGAVTIGATIAGSPVTSPQAAVTVVPGSVSTAMSILTLSAASGAMSITLQAVDVYGNDLTTSGLKVAFKLGTGSGKGTFGKVTYAGNGQYEVQFTGKAAGTNSVIATIGGVRVKVAPIITVS